MILTLVGSCSLCGGKVVSSLDTEPHCLSCGAKSIAGLPVVPMEPPRKWEKNKAACCRCGEPADKFVGSPSQAALMCDESNPLSFCQACFFHEAMHT